MKKNISLLFVLTVISSAVFAYPVNDPNTTTGVAVVKEGAIVKLYYQPVEQMDVKISIHDATDQIVFSEIVKKADGFVRPYNFSKLPEGDYTIEIVDKNGKQIESVTHGESKAEKLAHLTKIPGSEKYVLSVSNKDSGIMTVRIFDSSNNVIYDHQELAAGDFAKVYNLEKFSGRFVFEITDGQGVRSSLSY